MSISRFHRNTLLVEGAEDLRVIANLLDAHIAWGDAKADWPVNVHDCEGVDNLLKAEYIDTHLKTPRLEALGIVVDANDDFQGRWDTVRSRVIGPFPKVPKSLPEDGLIVANDDGLRLGVWIMPDNRSRGMLERFLADLRPAGNEPLWEHTHQSVDRARGLGAPVRDVHLEKARMHCWLSWQDPPGQSLHLALIEKQLDAKSDPSTAFVDWFIRLFDLNGLRR